MSVRGRLRHSACDSHQLEQEVTKLRQSGILTVLASGNDGMYNAVSGTACISSALTVGASFKDRAELDWKCSNASALVDFLALGTEILSATADGSYGSMTGTSIAALHVVGIIALLRSQVPTASADMIESILKSTAERTIDPRTGLEFHFPHVKSALGALVSSTSETQRASNDLPLETDNSSLLLELVGAKRITIQGRLIMAKMRMRILQVLGPETIVGAISETSYWAEHQAGFDSDKLDLLVGEFGTDVRFFRDDPITPYFPQ